MKKVYAILAQGELFPNYFTTYKKAVNAVKETFPNWDDSRWEDGSVNTHPLNVIEVKEGHKKSDSTDVNITELFIEKVPGMIYIHKLIVKPKSASSASSASGASGASGGYSRRQHKKINTNNSRKHRI